MCLLGLDETGTSTGTGPTDGDDLAAVAPLIGDRDTRSEVRQALLEAVLAARDHLVVTHTGHNVRTNQEVPDAIAFAELRDTITATLSPESRSAWREQIDIVHPRQPFDERCFQPNGLGRPGPWSFDAGALAGARARARRAQVERPFLEGPFASESGGERVVTLSELRSFFNHPVRAFLQQRLRVHLTSEDPRPSDHLLTSLDGLERWSAANRLITARLAGHTNAEWERYERALGAVPVGGLGVALLTEIGDAVNALLDSAAALGVDATCDDRYQIDVELSDHTRIVGIVEGRCTSPTPGPATLTFSRAAPKQHLAAWLDLVTLVATDPGTSWRSVVVRRPERGNTPDALQLAARGDTPEDRRAAALAALEVAVDCYRRGRREPVPLFPSFSYKLYTGKAVPNDWQAFGGLGDGDDDAHRMAFGRLNFNEVCALAACEDDPPGPSRGRAERFARYLWSAVENSAGPPK
ncbi:MAG: hypothetical protein ACYDGN_12450 [Acidimicrobiales bacterium]